MYERLRQQLDLPSIPALDGIRAISVGLVIFYHAGLPVSGPLGVLIFFVLSGFLITWLLLKEDEKSGTISLPAFYRRRTFRIFPAFYCFWVVSILLRLAGGRTVPWPAAWSSFFYYSNYYHAIARPADQFIIHTWSLAVEEQFYLCWPLLFLMLRSNRKRLAWVTFGIIAAVSLHRTILCVWGAPYQYTRYTFDCRADSLLWGCLLAIVLRAGFFSRFWNVVCSRVWLPLIPAVVIAWVAHAGIGDVITLTVLPPAVALLIPQLILYSRSAPLTWLNSNPARYLGQISYPLYLYHGIGTGITGRFPMGRIVDLVLSVAIAVAIASISYFLVEKPLLKYKTAKPAIRSLAAVT